LLAVAVQRDGAANWLERSEALVAVLDPKLLIEQAQPDYDRFTGEFRVDFVGNAGDGQATVDANQAPFRLPRKGAEPLPGAVNLTHGEYLAEKDRCLTAGQNRLCFVEWQR
jgi:hypothetical protein